MTLADNSVTLELSAGRFNRLVRAASMISRDVLASEPELLTLKWPDYGFEDPLAATIRFAREYSRKFREFYASNIDRNEALKVSGAQLHKVLFKPRELTQMWIARQHADRSGIAYPGYIAFAFDFAVSRKRTAFPRPNQLRPNEKTALAWNSQFEEFRDDHLAGCRFPEWKPQLDVRNDQGLPAQVRARETVLRLAKARQMSWLRVAREWGVERPLVPLARIRDEAGPETFTEIKARLFEDRKAGILRVEPRRPVADSDLLQACFGLPVGDRSKNSVCQRCPQAEACQTMERVVLDRVEQQTGSRDPRHEEKKNKTAARVQRFRAKRKALVTSSAARIPDPGNESSVGNGATN